MTIDIRWAVPLALFGGVVVGAALTTRRRKVRRQTKKREHKEGLHAWEGEGGSLAAPAPAIAPHVS